jgi:hypothetical protein
MRSRIDEQRRAKRLAGGSSRTCWEWPARIVAVDLHTVTLEGLFNVPLEHLSAMSLLANAIADSVTDKSVIVAPDLGAVKIAECYKELLRRPIAIAHKTRLCGEEVRVRGIVGEVAGRLQIIVDDMISTGGTIEAAAAMLAAMSARDHGRCQPCIVGELRDPSTFCCAAETNRGYRQSANSGTRFPFAAGGEPRTNARRDGESPERRSVRDGTPEPPMTWLGNQIFHNGRFNLDKGVRFAQIVDWPSGRDARLGDPAQLSSRYSFTSDAPV